MVAEFNNKANKEFFNEKLLFQTIGVVFLLAIVVLIFADIKIYQKEKEVASKIIDYQKQIEDIKRSSQNLKDEIANSDNQDYLEKIAYEQLGEAKPGETVYSFVGGKEKLKTVAKPQNFWGIFTGWLSNAISWLGEQFSGNFRYEN
ncbi:MAG: septum formation initiator family protein [Candidatus Staskawiczbacteria bacterium]|nr:septum formation initiator family protein [Candidatus Staskawiczbacteria bacterium]